MLRTRSKRRFSRAANPQWKPFFEPLESRVVLDGTSPNIVWPVTEAPLFQPGPISGLPHLGSVGAKFAVADFNRDGLADFVNIAQYEGTVMVMVGNGDGTFRYASVIPNLRPMSVRVGDFNGDGAIDLVVFASAAESAEDANARRAFVLPGNGDGTFGSARETEVTMSTPLIPSPDWVIVADVNSDGFDDLIVNEFRVTMPNTTDHGHTIWLSRGDGSFAPGVWRERGVEAAADFNSDGKLDLLVMTDRNGFRTSYEVLLNDGSGGFVDIGEAIPEQFNAGATVGDFNGDGKLDIVAFDYSSRRMGVFEGDGTGGFRQTYTDDTRTPWLAQAVGDLNGDGRADLVLANGWEGTVSVLISTEDGFVSDVLPAVDGSYPSPAIADFNGDGLPDVAIARQSGKIQVFLQVVPAQEDGEGDEANDYADNHDGPASGEDDGIASAVPQTPISTQRSVPFDLPIGFDTARDVARSGPEMPIANGPRIADADFVDVRSRLSDAPVDSASPDRRRFLGGSGELPVAEDTEPEAPEGEMLFDELFAAGVEIAGAAVDEVLASFPDLLAGLWIEKN